MSKVVFEETVGGNEWRLHDDGSVWEFGEKLLNHDGSRVDSRPYRTNMLLFAEKWRAEHWPRFAPLGEDEFGSKCGERFTMKTARVEDGDPTVETEGGRRFMVFNWPGNWRDDTEERVLSWWLANWQRPADEWFDRETKRVRKLRDDEGVTPDGELVRFEWIGMEAFAIALGSRGETAARAIYPVVPPWHSSAIGDRLESWARANLPAHLAIVDGRVVEMADDEARTTDGIVRKCSWWYETKDNWNFAPGQKERVEKWHAGQNWKEIFPGPAVTVSMTIDGESVFVGAVSEYSIVQPKNKRDRRTLSLEAIELASVSSEPPEVLREALPVNESEENFRSAAEVLRTVVACCSRFGTDEYRLHEIHIAEGGQP